MVLQSSVKPEIKLWHYIKKKESKKETKKETKKEKEREKYSFQ